VEVRLVLQRSQHSALLINHVLLIKFEFILKMPHKRRRNGRKSKFVTKRGFPFQLMKYAEGKRNTVGFDEFDIPSPAVFATNVVSLVDNIAGGSDNGDREGNIIQVSGVYVSYTCESILTDAAQFCRVIMWTPRIADSTELPAPNMVNIPDPDRFIIWYDKVHNAPFNAGGGTGVGKIRKKFSPFMKVMYNNPFIDSVTKNNLHILVLSKNNVGIEISMSARLYYKDV